MKNYREEWENSECGLSYEKWLEDCLEAAENKNTLHEATIVAMREEIKELRDAQVK